MIPQVSSASTTTLAALPTIEGLNGVYVSKCALFGLPRDPEISRRLLNFDRTRAREFDFSDVSAARDAVAFRPLLDALIAAPEIEALVWRRGNLTDEHVEMLVNAARRFIGLDEVDLGENPHITNAGAALLLQLVASRSIGTAPRVVRLDQTSVSFDMQAKLSAALAARHGRQGGRGGGGGGDGAPRSDAVMSPQVRAFLRESAFTAAAHADDAADADGRLPRRRDAAAVSSDAAAVPLQLTEDSRRFGMLVLQLVGYATQAIARTLAVMLWVRPLRTVVYAVCFGSVVAFLIGPASAVVDLCVMCVGYLYLMRSRKVGVEPAPSSSSTAAASASALFAALSAERRRRWAFLLDPLDQLCRAVAAAESGGAGSAVPETPTLLGLQQRQQEVIARDVGMQFVGFAMRAADECKVVVSALLVASLALGSAVRLLFGNTSAAVGGMVLLLAAAFFLAEPLSRIAVAGRVRRLRQRLGRWIAGVPSTVAPDTVAGSGRGALVVAGSTAAEYADEDGGSAFAPRRAPFAFVVEVLRIEDAVIRTSAPAPGAHGGGGGIVHGRHGAASHKAPAPRLEPVVKIRCMGRTHTTTEAQTHRAGGGGGAHHTAAVTTSAHWHPQASAVFPSPHPYDTCKMVFHVYDGSAADLGVAGGGGGAVSGGGTDILMTGTFLVDDDMCFGQEVAIPLKPTASHAAASASATALQSELQPSSSSVTDSVWSLSDTLLRQIDSRDMRERHRHHVYQNEGRTNVPAAHAHRGGGVVSREAAAAAAAAAAHHAALAVAPSGPLHVVDRAGVLVVRFVEVERSVAASQTALAVLHAPPPPTAAAANRPHRLRQSDPIPAVPAAVVAAAPPSTATRRAPSAVASGGVSEGSRRASAPTSSLQPPPTQAAAGGLREQDLRQLRPVASAAVPGVVPSATPERSMSQESLCSCSSGRSQKT